MKECSVCGDWKELSEFHKDKNQKDGHTGQCKLCKKKYSLENKELMDEQRRRWREANPGKVAEINRKWREENLESCRDANKTWREANPEYSREYQDANKKKISEQRKKSYQDRKAKQQEDAHTDDTGTSDRE